MTEAEIPYEYLSSQEMSNVVELLSLYIDINSAVIVKKNCSKRFRKITELMKEIQSILKTILIEP